jgi:Phage tail lysozyme
MAIMLVTRLLHDVDGNSLGVSAPAGSKVEVIETDPPLIQIRLPNLPGQPVGFVTIGAVDPDADAPPGPLLDKLLFAKRCAEQETIYGVSAHYVMSVAALRSNVTDGPNANGSGDIGPFALSPSEWKLFCSLPEFSLGYGDSDINLWRSQCAVFAVMTYVAQNKLATALASQPTPTELYLSQLVGAKAAIVGMHTSNQTLGALIGSTAQADFDVDGIDPRRIILRSPDLLTANVSVKDITDMISDKMQQALDNTRPFLIQVGAQPIIDPGVSIPASNGGTAGINFDAKVIKDTGHQDMARLIAQRFGEAGFGTVQQIAAIANAIRESGLNPNAHAITPKERSFGLFQMNEMGGRGAGHSDDELKDPEKNIAITLKFFTTDPKLASFKAAANLRSAVTIFVRNYEQPANQTQEIDLRLSNARAIVA